MPFAVGIRAEAPHLDRVRAIYAAPTVPIDPQADVVRRIVKVEIKVLLAVDRRKIERVHAVRAARVRPKIEREIASAKVPIAAVGNLDIVVDAVEAESLTNF